MVHVKLDLVSFVKDLKCYICFWNVFNMKLLGSVCSGDITHLTLSVICIWDALRLFHKVYNMFCLIVSCVLMYRSA